MVEGHEFVFPCIEKKSFSDDFFDEFSHAFNELDGAMRSGLCVVFLAWFGNCDDQRSLPPGMVEAEFNGSFEEVRECVLE